MDPYSADDIKRRKKDNSFSIPGTKYRIQFGLINGIKAICLLKDNTVIDYYYYEEDSSASGFLNQKLIVGWVLRTVAIPNINPHQIMKRVQILTKHLIENKDQGDGDGDGDDDHLPHPYIFKPPKPPGDLAMAPQVQVNTPLKEIDHQDEIYYPYCGKELTKEEQFTHSCKKKPE